MSGAFTATVLLLLAGTPAVSFGQERPWTFRFAYGFGISLDEAGQAAYAAELGVARSVGPRTHIELMGTDLLPVPEAMLCQNGTVDRKCTNKNYVSALGVSLDVVRDIDRLTLSAGPALFAKHDRAFGTIVPQPPSTRVGFSVGAAVRVVQVRRFMLAAAVRDLSIPDSRRRSSWLHSLLAGLDLRLRQ